MADLLSVLREEIRRQAKKELTGPLQRLRAVATEQRREIARLKRSSSELQKRVAFLEAQEKKRLAGPTSDSATAVRFSARSVRAHRERLKLSAEDYGKLLGVSPQTVYQWERGKSRPRKSQLGALVDLRSLGKREAKERLRIIAAGGVE